MFRFYFLWIIQWYYLVIVVIFVFYSVVFQYMQMMVVFGIVGILDFVCFFEIGKMYEIFEICLKDIY